MNGKPSKKHMAEQLRLPTVPANKGGRPQGGRRLARWWISEVAIEFVNASAAEMGTTPPLFVEEMLMRLLAAKR